MYVCYCMTSFHKKYHADKKEKFPSSIQSQIDELPKRLKPKTNRHSNHRIEKSSYLEKEDVKDSTVKIIVPQSVNIHNNWVFEVKSKKIGSFESLYRIGVRITSKNVQVTNTDTDYSNYEYCFIFELNPNNPYQQNVKLITVYLNDKNDYHNTLDKSKYTNKVT